MKNIQLSPECVTALCQKHGIRRLAIFGSALRDDFRPDSDVDILVEFEPDRIPTLFDIAGTIDDRECVRMIGLERKSSLCSQN